MVLSLNESSPAITDRPVYTHLVQNDNSPEGVKVGDRTLQAWIGTMSRGPTNCSPVIEHRPPTLSQVRFPDLSGSELSLAPRFLHLLPYANTARWIFALP